MKNKKPENELVKTKKPMDSKHNTEWGVSIIDAKEATEMYRSARAEIKTRLMRELLSDISLGIRAAADSGHNVYKSRGCPVDSEVGELLEDVAKTLSSVGYEADSGDDGKTAWVVVAWDEGNSDPVWDEGLAG
jgi:hypothetical protein